MFSRNNWQLARAAAVAWPIVVTLLLLDASGSLMTSDGTDMDKSTKKEEPNLVITPAGPVPKENVHHVGPNQEVRRQKDGSYIIVPKTDQKPDQK